MNQKHRALAGSFRGFGCGIREAQNSCEIHAHGITFLPDAESGKIYASLHRARFDSFPISGRRVRDRFRIKL